MVSTGKIPVRSDYLSVGSRLGKTKIPSFAFLIEHSRQRILFDIGLPRFLSNPLKTKLAPLVPAVKLMGILPEVGRGEDTATQLRAAGIVPSSIQTVIYSHHHFDHTGDIRDYPEARIVVGPGVLDLKKSWKRVLKGLNPDDLPEGRPVREMKFTGSSGIGPFAETEDFLGDGSIYLVNTPGHCTGAIGALLRLKSGWVFLAGDAVYVRDNYRQPSPKGVLYGRSADEDRDRAWQSVLEIRELSLKAPDVRIWPSHEPELFDEIRLFPEFHA